MYGDVPAKLVPLFILPALILPQTCNNSEGVAIPIPIRPVQSIVSLCASAAASYI
jgi:hypothetical protein